MTDTDLYFVLGVLPDAEDVVIAAAYRALAKRYHPDQWKGDPSVAHQRMTELNKAYAILGDTKSRTEYDKTRSKSRQPDFTSDTDDDQSQAFTSALDEVEDRWKTACSIYPDLAEHRSRLARISTSQAFAYVTTLLETKAFKRRVEIAAHLEQVSLERYFGTNQKILSFARELILEGHKAAAKALNHLVTVMGSDVDPDLLIARVRTDCSVSAPLGDWAFRIQQIHAQALASSVKLYGQIDETTTLTRFLGYTVDFKTQYPGGPLSVIVVCPKTFERINFRTCPAFVAWVQQHL